MTDQTSRTKVWRVIPFTLIALVMLVSAGLVLAGVPASAPAETGTKASGQQGGVMGLAPAQSAQARPGQPAASGPASVEKAVPPQPAVPNVTLYDQLNNPGTLSALSQNIGDFPTFSSQTADDFPVPPGQTWQVSEVDAQGVYFNGPGNATSFNVFFYTSVVSGSYTIPGVAVYTATAQSYISTTGIFQVSLSVPATLPGSATPYYVSVQANMNFTPNGEWGWTDRTAQSNGLAAWRNPGGGFGPGCVNWDKRTVCTGDSGAPDQMFRLLGNIVGGATPTATCVAGSAWTSGAPYPVTILDEAATSQGTNLYTFAGVSNGVNTSSAFKYDSVANAWTLILAYPDQTEWPSAVSNGTFVYVFNGYASNTSSYTNILRRYDPVANTYTTLAHSTLGTWNQAGVYLNGKIYRIAGNTGTAYTPTVEVYDIASNTWSSAAPLPQAEGFEMAVAYNGYIYVAGGYTGSEVLKTYRYDPVANTWNDAAVTDLPATRWGAATGVVNGQWIIAGGYSGTNIQQDTISLDLSNPTGAWQTQPSMPAIRARMPGAVIGSTLYVEGGREANTFTGNTNNYEFSFTPCATPTLPAATATSPAATNTRPPATGTPTSPAATATSTSGTPAATPTSCTLTFTDVPPSQTFYQWIRCLACLGIINGYPDGTFKPGNPVTRGQLSKIASNSAGFTDTPTGQQFQDVPPTGPGSTFYPYIYRLVIRGYINGYPCGGPGEPCIPPNNLPYFRPNTPVTRGQITKIISNAAGFSDPPSGQQFQDVSVGSTFYTYTYRLVTRGVMSGYPCGSPPAGPCIPPDNLPYFRPNNNATRGQTSKIDANTFFPDCNIPVR